MKAPKSAKSFRTVGLSPLLVKALAAHLETFGEGEQRMICHTDGRPVGRAMAAKYLRTAATSAGLAGTGWHDLRRHHASVLLSEGVSPALVAERLGHDLKTLLSTCAHVIRMDDDRVRTLVDQRSAARSRTGSPRRADLASATLAAWPRGVEDRLRTEGARGP